MFWNLHQLAGALTLVSESEPLVEALNGFSAAYRAALRAAMLRRLGLKRPRPRRRRRPRQRRLPRPGRRRRDLRWEPFFFDWFGGAASEPRAMAGPRAGLYAGEHATAFRAMLADFDPDRPERMQNPYFARAEPEELLYDEIEAIWAAIAERDDWAPFDAKLEAVEAARVGWGLGG